MLSEKVVWQVEADVKKKHYRSESSEIKEDEFDFGANAPNAKEQIIEDLEPDLLSEGS